MKLHKDYQTPDSEIIYRLDTGDGQFCEGRMRASVAEEIVHSAESRKVGSCEGFELVVNGKMMFPKKAFVFGDDEEIERGKRSPKKGGRPTHAELVKEADETMTNSQIHQAIQNAKQEKADKAAKAEKTEA